MEVLHERCAGLDVHKDLIVACRWITKGTRVEKDIESFGTKTRDLQRLASWLREKEIVEVVMEATGIYWVPVWNVLEEEGFKLCLANPMHVKAVEGRKSDVKDAEWLAKLMSHGMIRPSFVPPPPQRELRELVRTLKTFTQMLASEVQRLQKTLQACNIKLDSVLTEIDGANGFAIMKGIAAGETDPEKLAARVKYKIKATREELVEALRGRPSAHTRFMLKLHLDAYDDLQEKIERLEQRLDELLVPFADAVALLQSIPGIGAGLARIIVAEIGVDMSRFETPGHLVSWAGLCPRLDRSAGKSRSLRNQRSAPPKTRGLAAPEHASWWCGGFGLARSEAVAKFRPSDGRDAARRIPPRTDHLCSGPAGPGSRASDSCLIKHGRSGRDREAPAASYGAERNVARSARACIEARTV